MKPKRILHFNKHVFGARFACLGEHLAKIITSIDAYTSELKWYMADVESNDGIYPPTPIPKLLGDSATLIEWALRIDQFRSGAFAGVPAEIEHPQLREGGLWTEDEDLSELGDSVVEVRMFDTSYIIVGSSDDTLMSWLETEFLQRYDDQ